MRAEGDASLDYADAAHLSLRLRAKQANLDALDDQDEERQAQQNHAYLKGVAKTNGLCQDNG